MVCLLGRTGPRKVRRAIRFQGLILDAHRERFISFRGKEIPVLNLKNPQAIQNPNRVDQPADNLSSN
jgi:hypothetical protein